MLELVQMTVTLTKLISLISSDIPVRRNAYGQIKTSHNVKRIKPPLPPMKKTPKAPLHRSARNQAKMSQEVTS